MLCHLLIIFYFLEICKGTVCRVYSEQYFPLFSYNNNYIKSTLFCRESVLLLLIYIYIWTNIYTFRFRSFYILVLKKSAESVPAEGKTRKSLRIQILFIMLPSFFVYRRLQKKCIFLLLLLLSFRHNQIFIKSNSYP